MKIDKTTKVVLATVAVVGVLLFSFPFLGSPYTLYLSPSPSPSPSPPFPSLVLLGYSRSDYGGPLADWDYMIRSGVNKGVGIVGYYIPWDYDLTSLHLAQSAYEQGIVSSIEFHWIPFIYINNPDYWDDTETITSIANGGYDNHIHSVAQEIKSSITAPLFITFGPEMNEGNRGYGRNPTVYRQAWIRAYNIFKQEGVNAKWVFHPNRLGQGEPTSVYTQYYPGDAYVEVMSVSWHGAGLTNIKPMEDWFADGQYYIFAQHHNLEFMFAECGNYDNDQYPFITDAQRVEFINQFFDFIESHDVIGFIWYDMVRQTLANQPETNAFRTRISSSLYME